MKRARALWLAAPVPAIAAIAFTSLVVIAAVGAGTPSGRLTSSGGGACNAATGTAAGLEPAQETNAKIIANVAVSRGLSPVGAGIGIAVALAESTLFNYANDGTSTLIGSAESRPLNDAERAVARESLAYPHDRVGNNLDSIGLFQQRPMTGWGTPAELINPATSAGLFFDRLQLIPAWESLPPWQAAQIVQGSPSSDGGIYRDMYEQAIGIVTQLLATTSAAAELMSAGSIPEPCLAVTGNPALIANTSGGGSAQWGGYQNGRIPATALGPVPSQPALLLECTAAKSFEQLNNAFHGTFGQDIGITDAYRSFEEQVACRAEKGSLCADPGTSNHGWAKAVDIGACCGVNTGTGPAFDWLTANAATFGWIHPPWARPGGSKPEPWHWEFGSIS